MTPGGMCDALKKPEGRRVGRLLSAFTFSISCTCLAFLPCSPHPGGSSPSAALQYYRDSENLPRSYRLYGPFGQLRFESTLDSPRYAFKLGWHVLYLLGGQSWHQPRMDSHAVRWP